MLKMPLTINGVDFSAMTERLGYTISYEDRTGGNGMTMQNGDQYIDVVVRKPVLKWQLDSLTMTQLASLHAAINAAVYVEVTYYDTAMASTQTAYFHGTITEQTVGVIRSGGYYRFKAPMLQMKAR